MHLGELHESLHGKLGAGPNAMHNFCTAELRQRIPSTASRTSFREWCVEHLSASMQERHLFEFQLRRQADADDKRALNYERVRLRELTMLEEKNRANDAKRRRDIVRKFMPPPSGPRPGSPGREGGRVAPQ